MRHGRARPASLLHHPHHRSSVLHVSCRNEQSRAISGILSTADCPTDACVLFLQRCCTNAVVRGEVSATDKQTPALTSPLSLFWHTHEGMGVERTTTGLTAGGGWVGSVMWGVVEEMDDRGLAVFTTADDGRCSGYLRAHTHHTVR